MPKSVVFGLSHFFKIPARELTDCDLIVLGGAADNTLSAATAEKIGLALGKNLFQWQGKTYGRWDDGLFLVMPNPYNPRKVLYLVIANSALQLYHMTKQIYGLPSWALFKKDKIVDKGYHTPGRFVCTVEK